MSEILDVTNGDLRVVIYNKTIGYLIDIYEKGNIKYRLRCVKSKGKGEGVYLYYPLNSIGIGAVIHCTVQRELLISVTNKPEITIEY